MIKTYTAEELKEVLAQHELWLRGIGGTRANLSGANLTDAYLYGANLTGADLTDAYLYGANLSGANLSGANLTDAYLYGANLTDADLRGANLSGAKLPHFQIVPQEGSFVGYKKTAEGSIITLSIPADARRTSSLVGRKCRCDKAKVVSAVSCDGDKVKRGTLLYSQYNTRFAYTVGGIVVEPTYDDDIRVECTRGIHFFLTEAEARGY